MTGIRTLVTGIKLHVSIWELDKTVTVESAQDRTYRWIAAVGWGIPYSISFHFGGYPHFEPSSFGCRKHRARLLQKDSDSNSRFLKKNLQHCLPNSKFQSGCGSSFQSVMSDDVSVVSRRWSSLSWCVSRGFCKHRAVPKTWPKGHESRAMGWSRLWFIVDMTHFEIRPIIVIYNLGECVISS